MVGLVLGLALAFVKEAVDTSIKSVDEAERLANAPALAVYLLPAIHIVGTLHRFPEPTAGPRRRTAWRSSIIPPRLWQNPFERS